MVKKNNNHGKKKSYFKVTYISAIRFELTSETYYVFQSYGIELIFKFYGSGGSCKNACRHFYCLS